ncbi:uncharacterized protein si:ch211-171b20.3 [Syngnathoides biaculeatus]|uniref:uncharacterized protein si:ch211-171b20.3 n=1 Tax=Syngnathoides biaculeatus TaxID=300417 RepID=UPI002ADD43F0|nr:uncharacterized protein si:ch211-171b20.3 [Syngnathoides biaculeatus]
MGSASRRPPLREPIRKLSSMQPLNEKISIIPPRRDNHVHQKGDDQPCGFSKKLPENRAWRPFTLSYAERFKPNLCPAILFPSTFALRGLSRFPVQNCKYNRPKGNYVAYTLPTFKDNLKSELYPDPVMGASRSFLQRMSELSSLEEETAWEEKLKKMRLSRKASPS